MPAPIPYFFLVHLTDADAGRLASEQVWFEIGETPNAAQAAVIAAGFFSDYALTDSEVEAATVTVHGPYHVAPTAPAFTGRVVADAAAPTGWSVV